MQHVYETHTSAFVGISFSTHVIYNIVDCDGEFEYTGLSIIQYLRNNKNEFMAKIIESQSYDGIKIILDDEIIFNDFLDKQNSNLDSFSKIYNIMYEKNSIDFFYIYDISQDVLIIKTPGFKEPLALDYKSSSSVRHFRSILR